jgi:MFS family permease
VQLYLFLGIHAFICVILQGTKPIVSLYADSLGASAAEIGMLVSAYALLPMLLAIKFGKVLDRIGARKLTLYGAMGMFVSVIAPILYPTYYSLLFTQLVMGCSVICCLISMQKTIGNLKGNRDKLIAMFSLMSSLGEFIGPIQSSFIYEHYGIKITFGISAAILLLVITSIFFIPNRMWGKIKSQSQKVAFKSTISLLANINLRKALIISALVLSSKDLFVAYFPVYGADVGLRPSMIGIIISVSAAMAILIRVFQFPLVQRFGKGKILTATLFMSAISFFIIPLFSQTYLLLLISAFLGVGLGLGQPLSLVFSMNSSSSDRHGEVLGLRLTMNRISQFTRYFQLE